MVKTVTKESLDKKLDIVRKEMHSLQLTLRGDVMTRGEDIPISRRELVTIVAALGRWMSILDNDPDMPSVEGDENDLITNGGEFDALDVDEIDALTKRLEAKFRAMPSTHVARGTAPVEKKRKKTRRRK